MLDERNEKFSIEDERMRYTLLAGQPQLYNILYGEESETAGIEWITPETDEEVKQLMELFQNINK